MNNKAMQRSLAAGNARDISKCPTWQGYYVMEEVSPAVIAARARAIHQSFEDDVDYCDAQKEAWIWSIGRLTTDYAVGPFLAGTVMASLRSDLYQRNGVECLWLR